MTVTAPEAHSPIRKANSQPSSSGKHEPSPIFAIPNRAPRPVWNLLSDSSYESADELPKSETVKDTNVQ
jgi:hypothetical protein